MDSLGYGAICGFGAVVVNQAATLVKEWMVGKGREQKREWEVQDQDRKAANIAKTLAEHTEKQTGAVLEKIQENTAVNLDQINLSNHNAEKFADLHGRMDRIEGGVSALRDAVLLLTDQSKG